MKGGLFAFVFLSLVMAAAIGLFSARSDRRDPSKILIGAPDDSGGLIIHYVLHGREEGFEAAEVIKGFEAFTIKDCCTSTSEWALGADRLDLAVVCPDAAQRLVEKDPRFEITGPALFNSDVLMIRPGGHPAKVGIAHKRHYQERLVKERFSGGCKAVPMLPAGLPYAFERGIVDGVVIDVLKAFAMPGERISSSANGADLVTYVFVARKEFTSSLLYRRFMESYERAVAELGEPGTLARAIEGYKEIRWTDREVEEWRALRVRFVFPLKPGA